MQPSVARSLKLTWQARIRNRWLLIVLQLVSVGGVNKGALRCRLEHGGGGVAGRGGVTGEHAGQIPGAAERDAVASGDLVGNDAEPLGDHPAHEPGGEEAVLGAQDEPGGYRGPGSERPRAAAWRVRLRPASLAHGLLGQVTRNVMVEGEERITAAGLAAVSRSLLGDSLRQAGIGGPVFGLFSGSRDHAGDQDDRAGLQPVGD